MNGKKIGIIGALAHEVDLLLGRMENKTAARVSGMDFTEGTLGGRSVVVARCGIGKVFAALCAQTMILRFGADLIVNTGTAGTLTGALGIGDIAVSRDVVQWDMDTSPLGDPVGMISGINLVKLPADEALVNTVTAVLREYGRKYTVGTVASGDRFVADPAVKKYIADTFGGIVCEMEGAAVGHACYVNNVPFVVIRAVSDGGDDSAQMDYPTFAAMAAQKSAEIVAALVEKL